MYADQTLDCRQNLLHMALDLLIQSLTLRQMLERGSPPTLIYAYTAMIAGNAAVYAVCVLLPNVFSAFAEMLIGSLYVACYKPEL